jgi:hypothetical protein
MNRPTGVTVIAVLYFIGAAFCILGGLGMILGGGFLASIISQSQANGAGAGAGIMAGLGAALGIGLLICAAIAALLGWGLMKLKEWARITAIVFAALGLLFGALGLFGALLHFAIVLLFGVVIRLAINGCILWYLLKPEVKAAFQGVQSAPASI